MLLSLKTAMAQPLSIELKLEKEEYLVLEPIILIFEITNETDQPLTYTYTQYREKFNLKVKHNGELLKNRGHYFTSDFEQTITLGSKSSYIYYYSITPFYFSNSIQEKRVFLDHLVEGDYTIELEYNFGKDVVEGDDELIVKSNKLKFNVKQATDETEKTQLKKYVQLMTDYKKYDNAASEKKINDIIILDRFSAYSQLAQFRLITKYKAQIKISKYQNLMEKACIDNPNSYLSLLYALTDDAILNKMIISNELKGEMIQNFSKRVKELRNKAKFPKAK
jgi:hypothetical protein